MKNAKAKKKNKVKRFLLVFLIFIFSIIIFLNIMVFSKLNNVIRIMDLNATLIVADKIGFDLSSDKLTFGEVLRGGSATKKVKIKNNFDFPTQVSIYGDKTMEKFIIPKKIILQPHENKEIPITAKVSLNASYGEYKGKVFFKISKLK